MQKYKCLIADSEHCFDLSSLISAVNMIDTCSRHLPRVCFFFVVECNYTAPMKHEKLEEYSHSTVLQKLWLKHCSTDEIVAKTIFRCFKLLQSYCGTGVTQWRSKGGQFPPLVRPLPTPVKNFHIVFETTLQLLFSNLKVKLQ